MATGNLLIDTELAWLDCTLAGLKSGAITPFNAKVVERDIAQIQLVIVLLKQAPCKVETLIADEP